MTKFLIVRFSSIGDIVLTSPVIRCLKNEFKEACEIHYLTKKGYADLVTPNPYVDKVHLITKSESEVIEELKKESFDYIIDLHHNIRTLKLKKALGVKSFSFKKLNVEKWILVNFKKNLLPDTHIVNRYLDTLHSFNIKNDLKGLDFFFPKDFSYKSSLFDISKEYIVFIIGAKFQTKKLLQNQIEDLCASCTLPVILIGGKDEKEEGEAIAAKYDHVYSACGNASLLESAHIIKEAKLVITHDTGMMHIASAFQKNIISIWGNTVPEFGMYPFNTKDNFTIHQVENLKCRPCSKIGYKTCPKKHFKCMTSQNLTEIRDKIQAFIS